MSCPLWPIPKSVQYRDTALALHAHACPHITSEGPAIAFWTQRIATTLAQQPVEPKAAQWQFKLPSPELESGGYRLHIRAKTLLLEAADRKGLLAGLQTLSQWLEAHAHHNSLPGLLITDAPDFEQRGILLDISRGKVPRMDTLFQLVDRFSAWKINQLQLYIEHTFAYRGHRDVWQGHNPITPLEFKALAAYCEQRGIELVPNQNSFGHFHRWLVHRRYRGLAECPAGIEHPFSLHPEPFSLCPQDPRSLELLRDLYQQQVPLTSGHNLNVGLDETFDLGMGRSQQACEQRGKTAVYLQFLNAIAKLAKQQGRRMMFWGDILIHQPEQLAKVPQDAIPLLWGYEAGHPFAEETQQLAALGRPFYVCPGTSSWNSFGGRYQNAMANLREAAFYGKKNGATGYLITDWGDFGHLQPLLIAYPAFAMGAGLSWNQAGSDSAAPNACAHALGVQGPADACLPFQHLAEVHSQSQTGIMNGSALFFSVIRALDSLDHTKLIALQSADLEAGKAALDQVLPSWKRLKVGITDSELCDREIHWAHDLLDFAISFSHCRLLPKKHHRDQAKAKLAQLLAQFESVRNLRYRAGGATESKRYLWQCLRVIDTSTGS